MHAYLVELGYHRCVYDVGLYLKFADGRVVFVTVYVDDMMLAGRLDDINRLLLALRIRFIMKDLERVRYLLAMEIHYEPGVLLCLSQTAYIDQVLERFQMNEARIVGLPQIQNEKVMPTETDETKINNEALPYRELVGALQYLVTCTRPVYGGVHEGELRQR